MKTSRISLLIAGLLSIVMASSLPVYARQPAVEEVLTALGMNEDQIDELTKGRPVLFDLNEGSEDELAAGLAWYLPVPADKAIERLKADNPGLLDINVSSYGPLTKQSSVKSLSTIFLPGQEAENLLNAEPGSQFNLSIPELESFSRLSKTLAGKAEIAIHTAVEQHYRKILFERYEAYRRGGTAAIASYARKSERHTGPAVELRQAATESTVLVHYLPELHQIWLNYPKGLPPKADEAFRWVEKDVEGRPTAILRHRINIPWNSGLLVLTREFYAAHSYNASQWLTGCLPFRNGTVVFQQVRSFTDQVRGIASSAKHLIGRKLLKNKMRASFERFCSLLNHCH